MFISWSGRVWLFTFPKHSVILWLPFYGNVHYRRTATLAVVLMLRDGDGFSSRITFLLSGMGLFIRRGAGAAVREVDSMNVVEELLMPHPD